MISNRLKCRNFSFPEPLPIETSLGSILESNVNDKYTISDRLWYGHQRRKENIKLKVMDLDIQYLMRQALIQTPYLQDITKMVVKF